MNHSQTRDGGRWHRLSGVSMWPLTAPMQALVTAGEALRPGDIAVFIGQGGELVFHRVMAVEQGALCTKGDTLADVDARVPMSAVIGRVTAVSWGPVSLTIRAKGRRSRALRGIGLAWGNVAPELRRRYVQLRDALLEGRALSRRSR